MQHLEEGTIHAWLDGELAAEEAASVESHVAQCADCAARVAEARGLIAASTRILTALDDVPSGVIPTTTSQDRKTGDALTRTPRRRWHDRTDLRTAAALLFVAGASLVALRVNRQGKSVIPSAASMDRAAAVAPETAVPAPSPSFQRAQSAPAEPRASSGGLRRERLDAIESKKPERVAFVVPPAAKKTSAAKTVQPLNDLGVARTNAAPMRVAAAAPPPTSRRPETDTSLHGKVAGLRISSVAGRIEGRVTDATGQHGIASASILVQGTNLGATTDTAGRFSIDNVPAGEHRLIVRRIGYAAQTIPVSSSESVATADVALTPSQSQLSELVVTGVAAAPERRGLGAASAAKIQATVKRGPSLRIIRVDSAATLRRTIYEVRDGVQVTLVDEASDIAQRNAVSDQAAPAPSAQKPTNSISWTEGKRRLTLSGPVSISELESIKAELIKSRR